LGGTIYVQIKEVREVNRLKQMILDSISYQMQDFSHPNLKGSDKVTE
jgi:hypothetical protein